MDEMQEWEIPILFNNMGISQKQEWEQTRYMIWAALKPHLKNQHATAQDIFPLAWDKKNDNSVSTVGNNSPEYISKVKKMIQERNKAARQ